MIHNSYKLFSKLIYLPAFAILLLAFTNIASAGVIRQPVNNLNLTGYWSFDEGAGAKVTDFSGTGNTGSLAGDTAWVAGKRGKALSFDGNGDYVSFAGNVTLRPQTGNFSVSFWYKDLKGSSEVFIGSNVFLGATWYISNNLAQFASGSGGGNFSYTLPDNGQWHHLAFTLDRTVDASSIMKIYTDGSLLASSTDNNFQGGSWGGAVAIGKENWLRTSCFRQGSMDEVRVFKGRVLSDADVQKLYEVGLVKINSAQKNKLTDGLLGYWTFDGADKNGNTIMDVSGNNKHGTLAGTAPYAQPTIGKLGQALEFDGSDMINLPNINLNGPFTISMWIYPRTGIIGYYGYVNLFATDAGDGFYITPIGGGLWKLNFYPPEILSNTAISLNQWHHVVLTRIGGVYRYYLNGAADGGADTGGIGFTATKIGGDNANENFLGKIDEVRAYNRVLSLDEIKRLYNMGGTMKINKTPAVKTGSTLAAGLTGHWTFDGPNMDWANTSGEVLDTSGNGATGNLRNDVIPTIGKFGQALQFNNTGSTGNIIVSSNIIDPGTSDYSISFWYKGQNGNAEVFFSSNDSVLVNASYYIAQDQTIFNTANGAVVVEANYTLPSNNEWHHMVVTLNRAVSGYVDELIVYFDGTVTSTSTGLANFENYAANFLIGKPGGNATVNSYANRHGPMDEIRAYNRVLTSVEVKQLYNMGR